GPIGLSVNIPATMFRNILLCDMVDQVMAETGFDPARLTLEMTETSRIVDYDQTTMVIEALHKRGIHVSVDDFGTGTASYDTLLILPFDELKIDRSFIRLITSNQKARLITEQLINFARGAGMKLVAEGIEDQQTLALLHNMQCPVVQGYLVSKPLRPTAFANFIHKYAHQDTPVYSGKRFTNI
ncbi:MAG: EAL domain-containing protein, partial [Sphingomonadaceae bacterium]